eukprot:1693361-Rhodomonas_salina.5
MLKTWKRRGEIKCKAKANWYNVHRKTEVSDLIWEGALTLRQAVSSGRTTQDVSTGHRVGGA